MASAGDERAAPPRLDALLPPEMARRAEEVGVSKASMDGLTLLTLCSPAPSSASG